MQHALPGLETNIMGIIFSLIGLLFLLAILAGVIFFLIYMARQIGLLPEHTGGGDSGLASLSGQFGGRLGQLTNSLVFRFGIVGLLTMLMVIPLDMVRSVVSERSGLHRGVLNEISSIWGKQQSLKGPALLIPYTEKFITETVLRDKDGKILVDKDGYERKVSKTSYKQRTAILLPDDLKMDIGLKGQTRKRSLYEALVYTGDLRITGKFPRPDIAGLSGNIDRIHWDKAWFVLGISDTRAINRVSPLAWTAPGGAAVAVDFEPGTRIVKTVRNGFHAPLRLGEVTEETKGKGKRSYNFSLTMNVNGSRGLFFSPFGKTTNVTIKSDWPHPSFRGNVLPDFRRIDRTGFEARWSIPHLARNYPQLWTLETQSFNVRGFSAGVSLFESVSLYSQITRAIKYGVLFLALTYITFLIFELGIGRRLHIVQYGMIGLALSMFYLTLLSMAEHGGFFRAYIAAAAIIVVMISLYAFAAIRKIGSAALVTLMLTGLYAMLYALLKLEDYALLAGTAMLLVVLAVMMYLTRNIGQDSPGQAGKALENNAG